MQPPEAPNQKRKRGRPSIASKIKENASGRVPRASTTNDDETNQLPPQTTQGDTAEVMENSAAPKKRGRPRKSIDPPPEDDAPAAQKTASSSPPIDQPFETPESSNAIAFETVQKLFTYLGKIRDRGESDYSTFKGVSLMDFDAICKSRDRRGLHVRFDYDEETTSLMVKVPDPMHEVLHTRLMYTYIHPKMGHNIENWHNIGSTLYHAIIRGKTSRKEPDAGGGPKPARFGRNKWPTLVIESGYSESLRYLRRDMRRWFEMSNHDVKIVLLLQWNRRGQKLVIERWEEENRNPVYRTRQSGNGMRWTPVLQQDITITRENSNFIVTSGDLILRFSLLFLRAPQPGESDIVVTVNELMLWAEHCWALAPDS